MGKYENFDVCSRQALVFAFESFQIGVATGERGVLMEQLRSLRPYPDVVSGLQKLKNAGYQAVAFSNGVEATVRNLLRRAEILPHLQGIVSVDDLRTFKPDPRVYFYLAQRLGCPVNHTWLVSSNPFDVIGAKSVGLTASWINRTAELVLDPCNIHPDLLPRDLNHFAHHL